MNILTIIISIAIALLGYPIGLLIAKYTEEELRAGRKWFQLLIVACFITIIILSFLVKGENLFFLILGLVFIILLSLASLIKSKKRRQKID